MIQGTSIEMIEEGHDCAVGVFSCFTLGYDEHYLVGEVFQKLNCAPVFVHKITANHNTVSSLLTPSFQFAGFSRSAVCSTTIAPFDTIYSLLIWSSTLLC